VRITVTYIELYFKTLFLTTKKQIIVSLPITIYFMCDDATKY